MYLTRLRLDTRSKEARRDAGDSYEMHRTLTRAFVENATSRPARFLWRLEGGRNAEFPTVLVQSATPGEWSAVRMLPGYLRAEDGFASKHIFPERLVQAGRQCRFRLVANPIVCRGGKRLPLVGEGAQLAWMERQGCRHGFAVFSSLLAAKDRIFDRKRGIVVDRVCFEGLLTPEQPDLLREALVAGIGPAKAFGCGLLSIAPGR